MALVVAHPETSPLDQWQGLAVQPVRDADDPALRFADLVLATPFEPVPAPVPVLRFDHPAPARLLHLLLGWDLSDAALRALRAAWGVASVARVDVVMVDPVRRGPERSDPGGSLALALAARGIRAEVTVIGGDPAARLTAIALERRCDAAVLGGDGRGPVARALLGAGIPVLCGG